MRKMLLVIAAMALFAPAQAAAKELIKIEVCGASGCAATTDRTLLDKISAGGGARGQMPALAPYYKIVYTIDVPTEEGQSFHFYYVPGAQVGSGEDELGNARWWVTTPAYREAVATLAAGIQPFPKPQLTGVTIGSKKVADPASYERLLTYKGVRARRVAHDWRAIILDTDQPSPWSDGAPILMRFSPKRGYLFRDGRSYVLPRTMAARVKAGRSLSSITHGFVLGGALAAALGGGLMLRRRLHY